MAELGVTLDGGQRLAETLSTAAAQLSDLTPVHRREGEETLRAADIPRRTGRLADSSHVDAGPGGFALVAGTAYAGYVHARNPFFTKALDARKEAVLAAERETVVDVLSTTIEGA